MSAVEQLVLFLIVVGILIVGAFVLLLLVAQAIIDIIKHWGEDRYR